MKLLRLLARVGLGAGLIYAGISHLSFSSLEFQAQVPVWLALDPDFVVIASGVVDFVHSPIMPTANASLSTKPPLVLRNWQPRVLWTAK